MVKAAEERNWRRDRLVMAVFGCEPAGSAGRVPSIVSLGGGAITGCSVFAITRSLVSTRGQEAHPENAMNLVEKFREAAPKTRARLTGAVYLAYFLLAIIGAAVDSHSSAGRTLNVVSIAVYALLTVLFYFMFKPVNRWVSLLAALFSFAGCIFSVMQTLNLTRYAISPLIFFGFYCLLLGQLVVRSGFLPKTIGLLLVLAGVGWLLFLLPFTKPLNGVTEILGVVAEGTFCLWLLIAGVSPRKKNKQPVRKRTA